MNEHEANDVSALERLFAAERDGALDPGAAIRARLRARVASSVGVPMAAAAGGAAGATAVATTSATLATLVASKGAAIALAFVIGGAVGAFAHAGAASVAKVELAAPAPALTVTITMPSEVDIKGAEVPSADPRAAASPPSPPAPKARPLKDATPAVSSSASPVRERDEELAAERSALEVARTAVMRGQGQAALAALDEHAKRFPKGQLGPEREILTVQALVAAGRKAEARERAARFEERNPNSLLVPALRAAAQ